MTYKIDMGLYSVVTGVDVPKLLEYGRTAANFIKVMDIDGRRHLLNVAMIIDVQELESGDTLSGNVVGDIVNNVMSTMFAPKKLSEETIVIDDRKEGGE